jgi:hypothetical protein
MTLLLSESLRKVRPFDPDSIPFNGLVTPTTLAVAVAALTLFDGAAPVTAFAGLLPFKDAIRLFDVAAYPIRQKVSSSAKQNPAQAKIDLSTFDTWSCTLVSNIMGSSSTLHIINYTLNGFIMNMPLIISGIAHHLNYSLIGFVTLQSKIFTPT